MTQRILQNQLLLDFENLDRSLSLEVISLDIEGLFRKLKKNLIRRQLIESKASIFLFFLILNRVFCIYIEISMIYSFADLTLIFHVMKSQKILIFSISYHENCENSSKELAFFEENLCTIFDWHKNTTSIKFQHTDKRQFYLNDGYHCGVILKNSKLLERVKSPYQDIRVFDTEIMGRIMVLDGNVQISDELDDNYTIDMIKFVVDPAKTYEHLLILGAGDLVIPRYLHENYKNIKKITVVDIDRCVSETVRKYFKFAEVLEKEEVKKQIEFLYEDGALFVQNAKNNHMLFDGIIIDCTDVDVEDAVASSLFSVAFYSNLKDIMKKDVAFSQQISDSESMKKFEKMIKEAGFNDPKFIFSETPEYSVSLPIGIVRK